MGELARMKDNTKDDNESTKAVSAPINVLVPPATGDLSDGDTMAVGGSDWDETAANNITSTTANAVKRMEDGRGLQHVAGEKEEDEKASLSASGATNATWDWNTDPDNPYNWKKGKKWAQVGMASSFAILASLGISILAPAVTQLQAEFGATVTESFVPLSLYTFALGLGPVLGGPLSETRGRYVAFVGMGTAGALFTLGAGFVQSLAGLCVLRFLEGFCYGPSLAVSAGLLNDVFHPVERGLPSALFILTPFLGPGIAPLIGGFVVSRKGWRWTQWTLLFFYVQAMFVSLIFGRETYGPVLKRRKAKKLGLPGPPSLPAWKKVQMFITIALFRPVMMLLTEPIVTFICLYVAIGFATLFCFFASVPYVFEGVYGFSIEQTGLVYISIVVGCLLGFATIVLCDVLFYRPQIPKHPPHQVPPEWRLAPAMAGSFLIPLGVLWFGWTAEAEAHWASPAVAIMPFAWGNLCLFVSTMQYTVDAYHGTTVASAASANSLARYGLAGAFPLFTIQMYERLGIGWASSLLGLVAVALLPVPWVLFRFGRRIRAKSRYETASS